MSRLLYITVPMLRPTTLFLAVIGIIGSFQVFTQIFIMTSGGPAEKTTTVVYFIYLAAFKFYEFGYASTLSFGLLAILLVFTVIQLRLYRRGDAVSPATKSAGYAASLGPDPEEFSEARRLWPTRTLGGAGGADGLARPTSSWSRPRSCSSRRSPG